MKKANGLFCIILGAILLIAALSLVLYNKKENEQSGEIANNIVSELKVEMPETTTEEVTTTIENDLFAEYEEYYLTTTVIPEEPTIVLDNNIYIGIIEIPVLNIELPVMSDWSYPNLKISPCRYKGTIADKNLIIAAHNYSTHFGRINELYSGLDIIFTDMNGYPHYYEISEVQEINGKDVDAMDFGAENDWDLTIFTCTLSGQSRVTVRAVEIEKTE